MTIPSSAISHGGGFFLQTVSVYTPNNHFVFKKNVHRTFISVEQCKHGGTTPLGVAFQYFTQFIMQRLRRRNNGMAIFSTNIHSPREFK